MKKEIAEAAQKNITFQEKVRSMTAKEIIMAMVEGLKNPSVKVNMNTFGDSRKVTLFGLTILKVCYGCAATNTICKISGVKLNYESIKNTQNRSKAINSDKIFLEEFEEAIDCLRKGLLYGYNSIAHIYGFAMIKNERDIPLPTLLNKNYKKLLYLYEELANSQPNEKAN